MNRYVHASSRQFIRTQCAGCVVGLCLLATIPAAAQVPIPEPLGANPSSSWQAGPTVDDLLNQTSSALDRRDYHLAVQAFRQLTANALTKNEAQVATLDRLRSRFLALGFDDALLRMPPRQSGPAIQRLPDVIDAQPMVAMPSGLSPKQQALRLVAVGRAALDRGEITTALALAKQAQSLGVAEKDFGAGEPRPWQLELDAQSAARRRGIAINEIELAAASDLLPGGAVQPALATTRGNEPSAVQQTLHTGDVGLPPTPGNNIRQVQELQPLPAAVDRPNQGQQLLQAGLDALTRGDQNTARAQFKEAWKFEAELSAAERNQLKDKLTLLQAKRLAAPAQQRPAEVSPLQQADLEAQQNVKRLYREVTSELAKAEETKTSQPLNSLDNLTRLSRRVSESSIDEPSKLSLARMVDRAITDQKQYIEANRAEIDLEMRNEQIRSERESDQLRDSRIDEEVKSLVDSFNKLIGEKRFAEAEVIAKQVAELRPDHPVAVQLAHNARTKSSIAAYEKNQNNRELDFLRQMDDIDRSAVGINPDNPLSFSTERDWATIAASRASYKSDRDKNLSEAERRIKQKLSTPVSITYTNRPLSDVLEDLSAMTGVPIVIDHRALSAVRITAETPISISVPDNIRFSSALNLILEQLDLTHVIDNDVLEITSMESKRSRVRPVTYPVKDLVIPIPNFTSSYDDGLAGALRNAIQMTSPQQTEVHFAPVSATDLASKMSKSMSPSYMGADVMGQYHQMGGQSGFGNPSSPFGPGGGGGGSFADFDSLMELIQTTVAPETWDALGGPSSMQPYPQNLSLVISTTSEVHDQIVELLESLRRLQNLQITIEVRFITLADTFAEQIGVDFDVQFDDNVRALPDDDSGPGVTIGYNGSVPTADLDIRFDQNSFGLTPPFGSQVLGTPSTIGFAILSDIEAFFFLQAAQADNRSNIMQAPKVTMFDGQFASISDVTQRPFVTSIVPVVGDFAVAQQPVIVVLNEGTQLNVQGIVSDDKRFVRLTLVPYFSQIGDVDTFTYEGRRSTRTSSRATKDTDGDGDIDDDDVVEESDEEDIIEGTTVQLPTFASTSVQTTVSVPDGGTILLGGIKRLAEGRSERGVPVLSKIPYVSRLFRNVSAGRDARSLMLMVTPRIIIQEEEEMAQTGFNPNDP